VSNDLIDLKNLYTGTVKHQDEARKIQNYQCGMQRQLLTYLLPELKKKEAPRFSSAKKSEPPKKKKNNAALLPSPTKKKMTGEPFNGGGADAHRLAVFIDGENIPYVCWDQIARIMHLFGDVWTKRLYVNVQYECVAPWVNNAGEHGLEIIETPPNADKKNASDYSLISDAKVLLSSQEFGGFIIVSTDKDFIPLAKWGIEHGKLVVGIGKSETNISFRNECSLFVEIENIPPVMDAFKGEEKAVAILIKAFSNISQDGDWKLSSEVGTAIYQIVPRFNAKEYGSKGLEDLLSKIPLFEQRRTNGILDIRFKK